MRIVVLGSGAGGGIPQWNCRCPVCALARAGDPRVARRTQTSLAVDAGGGRWTLVNAAPDLRAQILATPALHPADAVRSSPIEAVVLTGGEIDQVAGLLCLREGHAFALHATPAVLRLLDENPLFEALDRARVERRAIAPGVEFSAARLAITPFEVPGKAPLYVEARAPGDGLSIGIEIRDGAARCVFIPACAGMTPALAARIAGADLLLFDGTTYTDQEMIEAGLSAKSAARMGHMAMDGPSGAIAALEDVPVGRRMFIHVNNSNPSLVAGSAQRLRIEAAGWGLAEDGMEFDL